LFSTGHVGNIGCSGRRSAVRPTTAGPFLFLRPRALLQRFNVYRSRPSVRRVKFHANNRRNRDGNVRSRKKGTRTQRPRSLIMRTEILPCPLFPLEFRIRNYIITSRYLNALTNLLFRYASARACVCIRIFILCIPE